jgi:hypothetical protein
VDWLLAERQTKPTVEGIKRDLAEWPGPSRAGKRKLNLFSDRLLSLAIERLRPFSETTPV